ncbi:hypothetical protein Ddye_004677 [Dipteronia dyeriana]|uniref:NB-ARC domain-containing protein n=1 Tax=Dipteronia dyeriana TaxID=168575 RepID=A0AAD9XEU5_9ROSI|nr:hypothetical protein Ddye_004677 [Dipteronia dyeriana]
MDPILNFFVHIFSSNLVTVLYVPRIHTDEFVFIDNIVKHILKQLNAMSSSETKGLVGIDTKIEQVVSLLGREDVQSVRIWGIGGISKITLAEAIFDRISGQFEGFYFILNIKKEYEQSGGLNYITENFFQR